MRHKAVIGAGFGDEGKGLFTDYLCQHAEQPLVIRFSGGQQAGHTVSITVFAMYFPISDQGPCREHRAILQGSARLIR